MIVSAANNLNNKKEKINSLNVFPVPDGDTGTNMGMTMTSAKKEMPNISGDLGEVITDIDSQTFAATMMGGINGYAISSYTKNPKASLLFIDFASRYEQVVARASKLGVVPARKDAAAAENTNAYSEMVYKRIEEGRVTIMPSVRDLSYVWSSVSSMFALVADDVTVKGNGSPKDYNTADSLKALLVKAVDDIKKVMQIS